MWNVQYKDFIQKNWIFSEDFAREILEDDFDDDLLQTVLHHAQNLRVLVSGKRFYEKLERKLSVASSFEIADKKNGKSWNDDEKTIWRFFSDGCGCFQ